MARESRKRTASARVDDDAPAATRSGRASAGASGSQRDAKAVKREKSATGKAPVAVEKVVDLDEDDDEGIEQNDADVVQMVRRRFSTPTVHRRPAFVPEDPNPNSTR
jgi:hypothetical protein